MELNGDRTTRSDFEPGEVDPPSPHVPLPPPPPPPRPVPRGSSIGRDVVEDMHSLTSFANAQLRAAEVCERIAQRLREAQGPFVDDSLIGMERAGVHCTVQALAALRHAESLVDLPVPDELGAEHLEAV